MNHTKLPWEWDGKPWDYDSKEESPWLVSKIGNDLVVTGEITCSKVNAEFIVKAVNNHYKLLSLVKQYYSKLLSMGQYEGRDSLAGQSELSSLRDAIALCEGVPAEQVQSDFEEAETIKRSHVNEGYI